ncbi:MAG: RNA methyltransferase [Pseudomonadota bacterium]
MAGTNGTRTLVTGGPAIVLVEPQLGENIGMVARAMANFGLSDLRLVSPRDGWPNDRAKAAASRADHVIEGAQLHDNVESAIADLNFVAATTARTRDMLVPVRGPSESVAQMRARTNAGRGDGKGAGILFGRERIGLLNEEIALADEIVTFPVNPAFASLNIAQAVLLMSYEWMKSGEEGVRPEIDLGEPAPKADVIRMYEHLERALDKVNYFFPEHKGETMRLNLRTILGKGRFNEQEVRTLRGVIARFEKNIVARPAPGSEPDSEDEAVESDSKHAPNNPTR